MSAAGCIPHCTYTAAMKAAYDSATAKTSGSDTALSKTTYPDNQCGRRAKKMVFCLISPAVTNLFGCWPLLATFLLTNLAATAAHEAAHACVALDLMQSDGQLRELKDAGVVDENTPELLRAKLALLYRVGVKSTLSSFRALALESY